MALVHVRMKSCKMFPYS